jgi:hypothetical protein
LKWRGGGLLIVRAEEVDQLLPDSSLRLGYRGAHLTLLGQLGASCVRSQQRSNRPLQLELVWRCCTRAGHKAKPASLAHTTVPGLPSSESILAFLLLGLQDHQIAWRTFGDSAQHFPFSFFLFFFPLARREAMCHQQHLGDRTTRTGAGPRAGSPGGQRWTEGDGDVCSTVLSAARTAHTRTEAPPTR